ncbi:MAG: hypothetical protein ACI8RD_002286 [Bacillariaceae sp.]|jgi:hypothetical protein
MRSEAPGTSWISKNRENCVPVITTVYSMTYGREEMKTKKEHVLYHSLGTAGIRTRLELQHRQQKVINIDPTGTEKEPNRHSQIPPCSINVFS